LTKKIQFLSSKLLGCRLSSQQKKHTEEIKVECSNQLARERKRRGIHILNPADVIQEVLNDYETISTNYPTTLLDELLFHYKDLHFLIYGVSNLYKFCKTPNLPLFVTKKKLRVRKMLKGLVDLVDHPK